MSAAKKAGPHGAPCAGCGEFLTMRDAAQIAAANAHRDACADHARFAADRAASPAPRITPGVMRHGIRVPDWYDRGAAHLHAVEADDGMSAVITERGDGYGYAIETWHDDVGLVTFWTSTALDDAVTFADAFLS